MATKSILHNITLRDRKIVSSFIGALENASRKKSKQIIMSKQCKELKGDQVKALFSEK